jgi:hypothetical protein
MSPDSAYDRLNELGVSDDVLRIVSTINGHNLESYESVLFCEFGYRSFEQLDAEDDEA